jgi:hypothetical protein
MAGPHRSETADIDKAFHRRDSLCNDADQIFCPPGIDGVKRIRGAGLRQSGEMKYIFELVRIPEEGFPVGTISSNLREIQVINP